MRLQSSDAESLRVEQTEARHIRSVAHFSWWHTGWLITDFSANSSMGLSLPAFFMNMWWDNLNNTLMLQASPMRSDGRVCPSLVSIPGAADISVHIMSVRPPMRALQIDSDSGNITIIRLALQLAQRRSYGQVAGVSPIQTYCEFLYGTPSVAESALGEPTPTYVPFDAARSEDSDQLAASDP